MKMQKLAFCVFGLFMIAGAETAQAALVNWTDWIEGDGGSRVIGDLDFGTTSVTVTYSGSYSFAQTAGGTNFWSPEEPYISSEVENAPPAYDIIALSNGGSNTITFSQTVIDPVIALVSWNNNTVEFGVPIEILSYGSGFFGNGVPELNSGSTGFYGNGEVHGVIRLAGAYDSITFTDVPEGWHGFTVGAVATPEPASVLLLGTGLALLASGKIRSKQQRSMKSGI
jgi:hypothetical protein